MVLVLDTNELQGSIANALGSYWMAGNVPVRRTVPLLRTLEEDTPLMQRIWTNSAFAIEGRDTIIGICLAFYDELKQKLTSGEISEASVYNPPSIT